MFCTVSRRWSVSLLLPSIKFLPTLYMSLHKAVTFQLSLQEVNMVPYFCHHLSDNYENWSDLDVVLSDLYFDLSDLYVD